MTWNPQYHRQSLVMAPKTANSPPVEASDVVNSKINSIIAPIAPFLRGKASTKKAKREKLNLFKSPIDYGSDNTGSSSSFGLDLGSSLQSSHSKAVNEFSIDYLDDVDDYLNDVCDDKCYTSNTDFNSSNDACDSYDLEYDFPAAYNAGRSSKEGDTRPVGKCTNKGIRRILATLDKTPKTSTGGKQAGESKNGRAGSRRGKNKRG